MATDPRRMRPSEVCRLLNSTPLGEVISDRQLYRHRMRAGLRIGDARHVDLLRYVAWLIQLRHAPRPEPDGDPYETLKERARARNVAISVAGRDIGPIPPVADPKRRARAIKDAIFFCRTYFPQRFSKPLSKHHLESLRLMQRIIEEGGCYAMAAPRGDGKTTRIEVMALWALLTGRRRFVGIVGASRAAANEILCSIKGELETNPLLLADFPEVCYPIQRLEGIHNRARGQLCQGRPTHIQWSGDLLVLPTIPGSKASGAAIMVRGITGRIRGAKFRRPDGSTVRPDLAIVDDPQTDRSAHSPYQVARRLATITGAILGWAGPGESIACFVACTVIAPGDVADQLLDREKMPQFQGLRVPMVRAWPARMDLWEQYAQLRRHSLRSYGDARLAAAFYRKHRREMDQGAEVSWSARYDPHARELSAIQHAMNLWIDDPARFEAEYQNQPRVQTAAEEALPAPGTIARKISGHARGQVPLDVQVLTAFVDVQQKCLYWAVCGWNYDFTGYCLDYGTYPSQPQSHFLYRDLARTLQHLHPGHGVLAAIRAGLEACLTDLARRELIRVDGAAMRINRMLVDAGNWSELIYEVCRTHPHGSIILPSKGKGITADRTPLSEWKRQPGQIVGEEWVLARPNTPRAVRLLTFDTNYWKTRLFLGLATPLGDRGSFSLYGRERDHLDHSMLAGHLTAETRTLTQGQGRSVYVYRLRPEKPDNHWLDCLVGNFVAASVSGCSACAPPTPRAGPPPPKTRVVPLAI